MEYLVEPQESSLYDWCIGKSCGNDCKDQCGCKSFCGNRTCSNKTIPGCAFALLSLNDDYK